MADVRGVGKLITYSDDNPISNWIEELREQRKPHKREPQNDAERKLLARWLGFRGRGELEHIVGSACYAYSHFEMDPEWRYLLADHIRTEAGHGWGYIKQADLVDPSRDHSKPDPELALRPLHSGNAGDSDYQCARARIRAHRRPCGGARPSRENFAENP